MAAFSRSHVAFALCAHPVSLYVTVSSYKDTSQIELGPTLRASFELNLLLKGPVSITVTFEVSGLELPHRNLGKHISVHNMGFLTSEASFLFLLLWSFWL